VNHIGWSDKLNYVLLPSKIEERLQQDDSSKNARWRKIGACQSLADFSPEQIAELGSDVQLAPRAYHNKATPRYLPITRELVWFLGWYTAEGTLSAHQVSLNLGEKDAKFIPDLITAIEQTFGETPRQYHIPERRGIKLYFHSVVAARLLKAWGLGKKAHEKRLPDLIFSLEGSLQLAFLEGYFLGDGTITKQLFSLTTNSRDLKDGLLYLLGQLGIIATVSHHDPTSTVTQRIQTKHDYYTISVCGKDQLAECRAIWQRHANATYLEAHIARKERRKLDCVPIGGDLMGLKVVSVEEIPPTGQYVYDFSVETDENFICGSGGLCAHNTDADHDGNHIRTLLLTFFFRYMQPLIQEGHLYVAQPPIFRLEHKKQPRYYYPETGLEENELLARALAEYSDPQKVSVSRYKGLGEMNPAQLWETTMDPARRTLLRITIDDAAEADRVFDMLMGSEVPPRRRFITTHARSAKLDV